MSRETKKKLFSMPVGNLCSLVGINLIVTLLQVFGRDVYSVSIGQVSDCPNETEAVLNLLARDTENLCQMLVSSDFYCVGCAFYQSVSRFNELRRVR